MVQDTSLIEIRCSLPMRHLSWLWHSTQSEEKLPITKNAYQLPKTPATVRFDVGAATCTWHGTLAYFDGGQVDQQTRMVPCRVVVERPEDVEVTGDAAVAIRSAPVTLLAGMFVNVEIHAAPDIHLLKLPERAVQPGNHVWTVELDDVAQVRLGTLHQKQLNVAHATDDFVLAYPHGSGLEAGDLIIVSPLASPIENAPVEIVEAP